MNINFKIELKLDGVGSTPVTQISCKPLLFVLRYPFGIFKLFLDGGGIY